LDTTYIDEEEDDLVKKSPAKIPKLRKRRRKAQKGEFKK